MSFAHYRKVNVWYQLPPPVFGTASVLQASIGSGFYQVDAFGSDEEYVKG